MNSDEDQMSLDESTNAPVKYAVLGIHYGHDANVALVVGGALVAAVQEERLTRQKFHSGFPFLAIENALRISGVCASEVDQVVIVGRSRKAETGGGNFIKMRERFGEPPRKRWMVFGPILTAIDNRLLNSRLRTRYTLKLLRKALRKSGFSRYAKIEFFDHHFSHALGAFYLSGYPEALVVTLDGKGDSRSGSVSEFAADSDGTIRINHISENDEVDSIGFPYSCVTEFLGFRRLRHEGKVTGLAAFGNSAKLAHVSFPVTYEAGRFRFRTSFHAVRDARSDRQALRVIRQKFPSDYRKLVTEAAGLRSRLVQLEIDSYLRDTMKDESPADVAAWVQSNTEKSVKQLVEDLLHGGPKNVVVSGGLFGNVRLNQVIREIPRVRNLFVLQGMGDGGLAVGPALHVSNQKLSSRDCFPKVSDVFLGARYTSEQIEKAIQKAGLPYRRSNRIEEEIAIFIHDGLVVGHFDGRMEWGPRALGNRSILARPTDAQINQVLNQRLRRTEFMPFAPMILDSIASDVLEGYQPTHRAAEFMTVTYSVKPHWQERIPAVVHVDGTARPQIVTKIATPRMHEIISRYQGLSNLGVVINTSFNLHEEPIVESPADALRSLEQDAIDILAISDFIVVANSSKL
jgi:carbamoyltransferase